MGKKKTTTEAKERASVSRERKLALALRAMLDGLEHVELSASEGHTLDGINTAEQEAVAILKELGYSDLEGIPRRVAKLNEQLTAAVAAGDGKRIAELGLELERAKLGKPQKSTPETKTKAAAATE